REELVVDAPRVPIERRARNPLVQVRVRAVGPEEARHAGHAVEKPVDSRLAPGNPPRDRSERDDAADPRAAAPLVHREGLAAAHETRDGEGVALQHAHDFPPVAADLDGARFLVRTIQCGGNCTFNTYFNAYDANGAVIERRAEEVVMAERSKTSLKQMT